MPIPGTQKTMANQNSGVCATTSDAATSRQRTNGDFSGIAGPMGIGMLSSAIEA